ncbi:MAG: hypothetical protein ABI467_01675 [Kofleriaceae bacterium]
MLRAVVRTSAISRGQLVEQKTLYSTALSVEWDDKPGEFVRWGRKVMQWVRRVAPGWHRYKHHRITTKADAARAAGLEMAF